MDWGEYDTGTSNEPKIPVTCGNATDSVAGAATGVVPGKTAIVSADGATTLLTGSVTGGTDPLVTMTLSIDEASTVTGVPSNIST